MRNQRGFTLLEVLVASAVMAIAIAGVLSALSTSMRNASRLTEYDRAAILARRKMDELLIDRKMARFVTFEGQWPITMTNGRPMGWRTRATPWEMAPNPGPGMPMLERIELEVWWQDGDRRRSLTLEGFRRGILTPADITATALQPK